MLCKPTVKEVNNNFRKYSKTEAKFSVNNRSIHGNSLLMLSSEGQRKRKVAIYLTSEGRDSSVGIATGYGLDGPGIESRWGRDFLHLSRPALGPT